MRSIHSFIILKAHPHAVHRPMILDLPEIGFGVLLLTGLLGSAGHCVGMCGGFVFAYGAEGSEASFLGSQVRHAAYNVGRIWAYASMGALCGGAGEAVMSASQTMAIRAVVPLAAGILMVLLGLGKLGLLRVPLSGRTGPLQTALGELLRRFRSGGPARILIVGFLNGFLPCGLTYAVLPMAAAAGGAVEGAALMAVFGSGTIPALWLLGATTTTVRRAAGGRLFRVAAVLVIGLGLLAITRATRVMLTGELSHAGHAGSSAHPCSSPWHGSPRRFRRPPTRRTVSTKGWWTRANASTASTAWAATASRETAGDRPPIC